MALKPISYQRYFACADYMYREMTTNIRSNAVANIRNWLRPYGGTPQEIFTNRNPGADILKAKALWFTLVAPYCEWDHKPKLRKRLGLVKGDQHFPITGDGLYEWFYDVWSNIHYGYVGTCAGFSADELVNGANVPILAGDGDAIDDATMRIGIRMWHDYKENIGLHSVAHELVKRRNWLLNLQKTGPYKKKYGGWAHILPMRYGNQM